MKDTSLGGRLTLVAVLIVALAIPAAALARPVQSQLLLQAADRPRVHAGTAASARGRRPSTPPAASRPAPSGKPATAGKPATTGQPAANLSRRVSNVVAARAKRFAAASAAIAGRIGRVSALADKVEKAGGDVTTVRAYLGSAQAALDEATRLEVQAVEKLKSIPGSGNPRAGLAGARAEGRMAVAQLKVARSNVTGAVRELREVVQTLHSGETSESP